MSAIVLSPEQLAAIFTPGHLLIRAGAGAGKTEVLARRFAALVGGEIEGHQPLPPERIAAITFTEKAAWDMRARIETVLRDRFAAEGDSRQVDLRRAIRLLPLARISTIHAFCARILRENAAEAGLDPDFQVLDEHESRTYFESLCRRGLVDAIRRGDPGAIHLGRAYRMNDGKREGAVTILMRIAAECARMGRAPLWMVEATRRTADQIAAAKDRVAELAAELVIQTEQLLTLKRVGGNAEGALAILRTRWPELRKLIDELNRGAAPEKFDFLRDFIELLPEARSQAVKPFVRAIREIVEAGGGRFGLDGGLIKAYGEFRGAARAVEVANLVGTVAESFERAKSADRVVTFDDLLIKVRDLLRDRPEVVNRYRAALDALLVDEYQDTDPVQDEIVRLIAAPGSTRPELFIVGDEKQSIYRFRGADVKVFNAAAARALLTLPLRENRRSVPNLLSFVNALSAHAMKPQESPAPPYWVEWRSEHELRSVRDATLDPKIEIIAAVDAAPNGGRASAPRNAAEKRPVEAAAIAARISALISGGEPVVDPVSGAPRPAEYRDVAILFRAFTDVAIYERALTL
ncbi:MAG TPA: UvrD-helicase domain-containing protein, partial [Candidatus Binataceae bacterium]|nr:UvrD-helicase domain-containing protein [Candidatus Binataceae bacterium]